MYTYHISTCISDSSRRKLKNRQPTDGNPTRYSFECLQMCPLMNDLGSVWIGLYTSQIEVFQPITNDSNLAEQKSSLAPAYVEDHSGWQVVGITPIYKSWKGHLEGEQPQVLGTSYHLLIMFINHLLDSLKQTARP